MAEVTQTRIAITGFEDTDCLFRNENESESLQELSQANDFLTILQKHGLQLSDKVPHHGGFGVVFYCTNGTVLRVSSLRIQDCNYNESYFNINITDPTPEQKLQIDFTKATCQREFYSYSMLKEETQHELTQPFLIPVLNQGNNKISDYIFCVNLPCYQELSERMQKFDETEVLKMVSDILNTLELAHNHGRRHRDIKPDNIMYDTKNGVYVLIDWGCSCSVADSGEVFDRQVKTSYAPVFTDPLRLIRNSNETTTDFYSLGVVMTFLAHPDGYFAGTDIETFHAKYCPESVEKCVSTDADGVKTTTSIPIMDISLTETLSTSELYRTLAQHALEHKYETANKMLEAMKHDKNMKKIAKNQKASAKILHMNPLYGIVIVLFLIGYTYLLSLADGAKTITAGKYSLAGTILMLLICGMIPLTGITCVQKGTSFRTDIRLSTIIVIAGFFCTISLPTWFLLHRVSVLTPLLLHGAVFLLSCLLGLLAKKSLLRPNWKAYLLWGCVAGSFIGLGVSVILFPGPFSGILLAFFKKLWLFSLLFGGTVGLWICFLWFLWHTRLKK